MLTYKGVTMNRKIIKSICVILSVLMFFSFFTSCGKDNENDANVPGSYDMIIDSASKVNCDYLLIYHNTASYSEIESFVDFLEKLSGASTKSFQICPDTVVPPKANQKIILLGNTNYAESAKSAAVIDSIRSNNYYDYLLYTYDNILSVNWVSKFGRQDAFEYILKNMTADNFDSVFNKKYSMLHLSQRSDAPIVTINDVNIVQYSVIMNSAPSYLERSAAERLVRAIKDATGVEVPLLPDSTEESTYEILVGNTNRAETAVTTFFSTSRYAVAQYGNKMILRGGQIEATSQAVMAFTELIEKSTITAEPLHIRPNYTKTGVTNLNNGELFDGYKLKYKEDFNDTKLDTEVWSVENAAIPSYGVGALLMNFSSDAISYDNQNLIITTRLSERGYESAHITTHERFTFQYGYVEIRARFHAMQGLWSKMLLTNQNLKGDTVSQIDVFNIFGDKNVVSGSLGTLDKDTYYENYLDLLEPKYEAHRQGMLEFDKQFNVEEYHTFGVEWTPEYVRFFVDGKSYGTVEISSDKYKDLHTEMYLDFMAGVNLSKEQINDKEQIWPVDSYIDWIRIYQKDDGVFTDLKAVTTDTEEK